MKKMWFAGVAVLSLLALGAPYGVQAQSPDSLREIVTLANTYQLQANITYREVSGVEQKLDIYQPRGLKNPNPTLVWYHGGGWTAGAKEGAAFSLLPYLQMGYSVVNVEYRLNDTAPAPAAVEDARCALRWIYRNAKQYNFDTTKIVTSGGSAGGHLAMITGMLPGASEFDYTCPGDRTGGASNPGPTNTDPLKVAAIVDWYGISDVNELLAGPNMRAFAVGWLGANPNRDALAKLVSPLTYVKAGIPPIISIHGDADPTVPYTQKVAIHEALKKANLPAELVTIKGGRHGGFTNAEMLTAYTAIRAFLAKHNLPIQPVGEPTRVSSSQ
jgi:acetyl esterase/lipase